MSKPPSIIFRFIAITASLLILLALCVPMALSTDWGKRFLENQLSKKTDSKVQFDKVSFQWIGPQKFTGIRLVQEEEHFELTGDEIVLETPFWNLIFHDKLPEELVIKNLSATITPNGLGIMGFRDLNAKTMLSEENTLEAVISGNTIKENLSGPFHLDLSLKELTPEVYYLILKRPDRFLRALSPTNLSAHAEIHDFPVPILDALYELGTSQNQDVFTSILGNTLTLNVDYPSKNTPQSYTVELKSPLALLQAEGEIDAQQSITMHGKLKTSALYCPEFSLIIDQGIVSLNKPAEIDVTLPFTIASQKTPPSKWKLERVVLPFFSSSSDEEGYVELSASSLEPFRFNLPELNDTLTVSSWQILLIGDPKAKLNYQAKLQGHTAKNSLITNVLGRNLEISSHGMIQLGNYFFKLLDGKILAQSEFGSLSGTADWDGKKQDLFIKDTLQIDLSFDSPFVKSLLSNYGTFDPQAKLVVKVDPLHIDLNRGKLLDEHYTGSLQVSQVDLTHLEDHAIVRFENIQIPFEIDGKSDVARLSWSGTAQLNGQEKGQSEGRVFLQHWREGNTIDISKTLIGVEGQITKFPLLAPHLVPLLGPIIDAQIHINWDPAHPKRDTLEIVASGNGWKSNGNFQYQKGILTLGDSLSERPNLKIELTHAKIKALSTFLGIELPFQAAEHSQLQLALQKFRLPIDSSVIERGVKFDVTIQVEGSHFAVAATPAPIFIEKIKGEILSVGFPDQGTLSFEAQNAQGQKLVETQGTWQQTEGKLALKDIKAQWKQLPTHLLAAILNLQAHTPVIHALVGPDLTGHLHLQENGELEFDLIGLFGKHAFKGMIQDSGLVLKEPLVSEVIFNPYLQVLLHSSSFGGTIRDMEGPITLKLLPNGTFIPLFPFQLERLRIADGMLNMGTVNFLNEGSVKMLLDFLKEDSLPYASIKATPLFFSLDQGVITIKRFDFLVLSDFPMAMWGSINLMVDKLKLTLGLTPRTLYNAVGLTGLKEGNLVQIPIKGTLNAPTVDARKATKKVTKLVIENQIVEGTGLANVMNILAGGEAADQSEPAPAPTTNPLPWETRVDTALLPRHPSSPILPQLEPVKKLGKGVGSLLKSIVD